MDCEIRLKLAQDVQGALSNLVSLIHKEREAMKAEGPNSIRVIDELLEKAFGEKQRAMGALHQHRREHGCDDGLRGGADNRRTRDDAVDEASKESFPASDPPAF